MSFLLFPACTSIPSTKLSPPVQMVIAYCRESYPGDLYCGGKLGWLIKQGVRQNLKTYGNPTAAQKCSDKLFVSVSQLNPVSADILNPVPWTISKFSSLDDLAELAGGTCFLSCFMAYKPYTQFRSVLKAVEFKHARTPTATALHVPQPYGACSSRPSFSTACG